MQNNIATLSNKELLELGHAASAGADAVGAEVGLKLNPATKVSADSDAAGSAVRAYQTEVANRVTKANALETAVVTARAWCFRAKDTLKPFLGNDHSTLWRPSGFVQSLRVPDDYSALFALVGTLAKYLAEHPEQKNDNLKVNVTSGRAQELHEALRTAKDDLQEQDEVIGRKHDEQEAALQALRARLRGLASELRQLIGDNDSRWHRFGLNIPAEPKTPPQPEEVVVNNTTPGQLLVSCAAVPFAARYRWWVQKVGTTDEPIAAGSSDEPLFVVQGVDGGARYNVFASAVNAASNEGPRSKPVVSDVLPKAA